MNLCEVLNKLARVFPQNWVQVRPLNSENEKGEICKFHRDVAKEYDVRK